MKEEALKLADEFRNRKGWACIDVVDWSMDAEVMIRRLVEELDKLDEPVAWVNEAGDFETDIRRMNPSFRYLWIPLYTTPQTKPLSDEKIYDYMNKTLPGIMNSITSKDLLNLARAIEERHGIK